MKDLPGAVGYGVIVLMLEVLRNEPEFKYPMKDLDLLAAEFNISLPILTTVVSSYNFFEIKKDELEEVFISPMLNELMLPYLEKIEKNRIAGKRSAEKRAEKSKEKEILLQLSQLDSGEQVLNTCSAFVQENKEDKSRKHYKKEKNNLSYMNFSVFKEFIINNYKNKIVCYGPACFLQDTPISISSLGYLHNNLTSKDLDPEDAKKVWEWISENQDKLVKLEEANEH